MAPMTQTQRDTERARNRTQGATFVPFDVRAAQFRRAGYSPSEANRMAQYQASSAGQASAERGELPSPLAAPAGQRGPSSDFQQRERDAGLYLGGNDPMAGRRAPQPTLPQDQQAQGPAPDPLNLPSPAGATAPQDDSVVPDNQPPVPAPTATTYAPGNQRAKPTDKNQTPEVPRSMAGQTEMPNRAMLDAPQGGASFELPPDPVTGERRFGTIGATEDVSTAVNRARSGQPAPAPNLPPEEIAAQEEYEPLPPESGKKQPATKQDRPTPRQRREKDLPIPKLTDEDQARVDSRREFRDRGLVPVAQEFEKFRKTLPRDLNPFILASPFEAEAADNYSFLAEEITSTLRGKVDSIDQQLREVNAGLRNLSVKPEEGIRQISALERQRAEQERLLKQAEKFLKKFQS